MKNTCQFQKTSGDYCKRNVSEGEKLCWQHARNWHHRWKSLTRNQTISFIGLVLSLLLAVGFGWAGLHHSLTKEEIAREVVKQLPPLPRQHDVEKQPTETLKTDATVTVKKNERKQSPPPPKAPSVGNITQGPGSITQIGGQGNTAVVIGAAQVPPRTLTAEQSDELVAAISAHPTRILILYVHENDEAFKLATQIAGVAQRAGWTLKQPVTSFWQGGEGGPLHGLEVNYRGERVAPGTMIHFDLQSPWGTLAAHLGHFFPDDFHVNPYPDMDAGEVNLVIHANPAAKMP